MKQRRILMSIIIVFLLFIGTSVYATNTNNTNDNKNNVLESQAIEEALDSKAAGQIVELKNRANEELKEYEEIYGGNKSYGFAAYILDKVRIFSIPVCFVGLAISVIFQHVIGSHRLDSRDFGYKMLYGFATLFIVAQVLPIVYALIVRGWGGL